MLGETNFDWNWMSGWSKGLNVGKAFLWIFLFAQATNLEVKRHYKVHYGVF